jgi:hypothetical protein
MNYKIINKLSNYLLILVLLLLAELISAAPKTKVLHPRNTVAKVSIVISGKSNNYYRLSSNDPAIIIAKGPGKLKIITRGQFHSASNKSINYTVFYKIDGVEKIEVNSNNVIQDANASFKDASLGFPAVRKDLIIELSRGEHTIEFWKGTDNPDVNCRFLFTGVKDKKIEWLSISPMFPNEPVSLVTNEDVISYYRFSERKPLKIKITGPTTLRVLNRFENDYQMKGVINYRIQVKEDGKIKNTYMLNSIPSDVTKYKNDGRKTPGKVKEIIIDVSSGTHSYEIIPLDKDKNTVLARVLFPKKDVKLEE